MTGDVVVNRADTEEGHNSRWWHDHAVGLFTAAIVVLLCGVGATAVIFLFLYWDDAARGKREIEVVKTCLQVLGVVLVGAFITLAGAALESARGQRAEKERTARSEAAEAADRSREEAAETADRSRKEAAEAAERRRRDLEIRSALLDRASRCAQDMFIHGQHVKRQLKDAASLPGEARENARRKAFDLLDASYLRFATESRALTNLIEARYHCTSKEPLHNPDGWPDSRILIGDDQAGWRWHQVEDLLTVYYFGLYEDWRVRILDVNSRGYEDRYHCGYDLTEVWTRSAGQPPSKRFGEVRNAVRDEYVRALPEFVEALLRARARPEIIAEPTPSDDESEEPRGDPPSNDAGKTPAVGPGTAGESLSSGVPTVEPPLASPPDD